MDAVYTTEALSTGAGRDGRSVVKDSDLDFTMTAPKEMGGSGEGANPEQLFAAGYAACYHSALKAVAKDKGVDVENSTVGARVSLGKNDEGFYLGVDLEVTIQALRTTRHKSLPTPPTRCALTPKPPAATSKSTLVLHRTNPGV